MKKLGLLACFVVASFATTSCVNREAQAQAARTQAVLSDQAVVVTTKTLAPEAITDTLDITGDLVSDSDSQIGAKSSGRLTRVFVKDGDVVKAGQVIAQQEVADQSVKLRSAASAVAAARAQLSQAKADSKQGPVKSDANVKASIARLKQAQANLDKVKAGARSEEREQTKAQVESARINMETARREMDRNDELLKQGAISAEEAERTRNAYASALSSYEQALENQRMQQNGSRSEDIRAAEEAVRQAEQQLRSDRAQAALDVQYDYKVQAAQANLDTALESYQLAKQGLGDATIRSPFNGTVSGKPLTEGTFVNPGQNICRIVGAGGVYFQGQVPETDIGKISNGTQVMVQVPALKDMILQGHVIALNPVASDVGRLFNVRVVIDNADGRVKSGMFAGGRVEVGKITDALVVPKEAVLGTGTDLYVYAVRSGKAKKVAVKILRSKDGLVQIDGAKSGDEVVVKGQEKLADGSTVKKDAAKPKAGV